MKAANKTILFTKTQDGAKVDLRPVAVFANDEAARPFAVAVMTAYKTSDLVKLKELGMDHIISGDKVAPGLRFTRVTVPYAPEVLTATEDPFAEPPEQPAK